MKTSLSLVFTLIILLSPGLSHSWWPFSEEETPGRNGEPLEEQRSEGASEGGQESVRLVRFESVSLDVEKKFLDEAKQLLRISPLQKCQHNVSQKKLSWSSPHHLFLFLSLFFLSGNDASKRYMPWYGWWRTCQVERETNELSIWSRRPTHLQMHTRNGIYTHHVHVTHVTHVS